MAYEWNLDVIYHGTEDPQFQKDWDAFEKAQNNLKELVSKPVDVPSPELVCGILQNWEETEELVNKLYLYLGMRQAVNTEDGAIMAKTDKLMRLYSEGAAYNAAAKKILSRMDDIDALAEKYPLIKTYAFLLKENKKDAAHLLSDEVEAMVAAMNNTGGAGWGRLQSYLTSTLKVDYEGEVKTLSEIRNLAYSADKDVRKKAYDAEIKAYAKVEDSVAFALNNIKNQVTMLCAKRGYASPLDMTLEHSRMSRRTLDAMMEAVKEYLPVFRKYLKKKAELLGFANGLPFYELFAPLGESEKTYTVEETHDYLLKCFETLSPEVSSMMKDAFDQEWIDFFPKNGKEGGAFCAGAPCIKQSRILTNFDGTFGAVDTLAHELGHAFHDKMIENNDPLNRDYPMPIAETASTFNEVHLGQYALKSASEKEKLSLLESSLRENTQCVVDIYCRYLFETAVFEKSQEQFLMPNDLKEMMLDCQRASYGDGLDPDAMHPYMWLCKGHYYSSGLSFYNFPYTFGNLFAQGIYAKYLREGPKMFEEYKEMLRTTPVHTMEENGALLGLDITTREFWESSLQLIADQIEEFCKLG